MMDRPTSLSQRSLPGVAQFDSALTDRGSFATEYLRALRPQHWLKNLLAFVPLFAAHLFVQPVQLGRTLACFPGVLLLCLERLSHQRPVRSVG